MEDKRGLPMKPGLGGNGASVRWSSANSEFHSKQMLMDEISISKIKTNKIKKKRNRKKKTISRSKGLQLGIETEIVNSFYSTTSDFLSNVETEASPTLSEASHFYDGKYHDYGI